MAVGSLGGCPQRRELCTVDNRARRAGDRLLCERRLAGCHWTPTPRAHAARPGSGYARSRHISRRGRSEDSRLSDRAGVRHCRTTHFGSPVKDGILLGVVILAFAGALACHVTLAVGLSRRSPRLCGLVAFIVPPLGPHWGWRKQMRFRSAACVACIVIYAMARLIERR